MKKNLSKVNEIFDCMVEDVSYIKRMAIIKSLRK